MFQERVSGEDTVVRLNDRCRDLRRRVNSETKLGFFPIVHREPLKEKRPKTRPSSSTNSVEDKEAIERIYQIKRVKIDKPFSFVCSDLTHISEYAHVSNRAFRVMKHLVPGPYTFILPAARMKQFPRILVSRRKTVGIRVPRHRITQAIISELGHPILSTSVVDPSAGTLLNDPVVIQEIFGNQVELVKHQINKMVSWGVFTPPRGWAPYDIKPEVAERIRKAASR